MNDVEYWTKTYNELKLNSLCLDCEFYKGKISLVGLYRPREGYMEHEYFLKGETLEHENLKNAFSECKMLITYNGFSMDIPKINKEFPGVIPKVPMFDVYLFAKNIGLDTNLKVLETTLGIERNNDYTKRRKIASDLYRRWIQYHDEQAKATFIEYNRQDTINLYPIAEKLVKLALEKKDL